MKRITRLFALLSIVGASAKADPLKALIVDGQNNHDWRACTPVLRRQLEETGLFAVDVATSPTEGGDMSLFRPPFSRYDVVVLNYTGDPWPEETKSAFTAYVKKGGGVVVVHAADNAFADWPEYNEMIGLGGWGGRNKQSGPYCYWVNGETVRDIESDGPAGAHEGYGDFVIDTRQPDHPIMRGLPARWRHRDEMYNFLRGPAKNMTLLATAHSNAPRDKGGSGRHEPMLFTISYGEGRIFHTVLGHDTAAMKLPGFRITFVRGAEWAAKGEVTLPVPEDFSGGPGLIDALVSYGHLSDGVILQDALRYVAQHEGDAKKREEIEGRLIQALQRKETDSAAIQAICDLLGVMGTARSVPVLKKMVKRQETSHKARLALERMDCAEATDALMVAARRTKKEIRIGVLNSLGLRGDDSAVQLLARFAKRKDLALRMASYRALGRLGSQAALEVMTALPMDSSSADHFLSCAHEVADRGGVQQAREVFEKVLSLKDLTKAQEYAALGGLLKTAPAVGTERVLKLMEEERDKVDMAIGLLMKMTPSPELSLSLFKRMEGAPKPVQIGILGVLGAQGEPCVLPQVIRLARKTADADFLRAAVRAVSQIPGTKDSLRLLADVALLKDPDLARPGREALTRVPGDGADREILKGLRASDLERQILFIQVAESRHMAGAVETLMEIAQKDREEARREAWSALRSLVTDEDYERLITLAKECPSQEFREEAVKVVLKAGHQVEDAEKRNRPYLDAIRSSADEVKASFIGGMIYLEGEEPLALLQELLRSRDEKVRDEAYRALGLWKSPSAISTILSAAEETDETLYRVLLMRGFCRLLKEQGEMTEEQILEACGRAVRIGLEEGAMGLVFDAVAELASADALAFVDEMGRSVLTPEQTSALRGRVLGKMAGQARWTASHNEEDLHYAKDGDEKTRWSSEAEMASGMWIRGDFGIPVVFQSFALDSRQSAFDFAPTMDIYVSNDGEIWGDPVLSVEDAAPLTEVDFGEKAPKGRYVKIVPTSYTENKWWSIHEMSWNVHYELDGIPQVEMPSISLASLMQGEGFIKEWLMSGPHFKAGLARGEMLDWEFAPEVEARLGGWQRVGASDMPTGIIDFLRFMDGENRCVYLGSILLSEKERDVLLRVGSDDGVKIWLNREVVHKNDANRPVNKDQDTIQVHLQEGENPLLVKIGQNGGQWAACVRVEGCPAAEEEE